MLAHSQTGAAQEDESVNLLPERLGGFLESVRGLLVTRFSDQQSEEPGGVGSFKRTILDRLVPRRGSARVEVHTHTHTHTRAHTNTHTHTRTNMLFA